MIAMMIRPLFVAIGLACLCSLECWARLGESIPQARERYGAEISGSTNASPGMFYSAVFKKGDMRIELHFTADASGASHAIVAIFQKTDESKMNHGEVEYLLDANAQGHKWSPPQHLLTHIAWTRDDGAEAIYDAKHALRLVTPEAKRLSETVPPSNLKGF
jgi:hypothetical protein